ncbi:MAG: eukaryotic-like serine/threonine-protein kinase, partial [Solirubrobacteraceae bacterium]|nr:eukaryotic-like serine/threonine-protein kinase [Solirubrobacteraceae bacterium]
MRVVGEYEIGETLGRGGTSVVYLARHRVTGREVALKELWLGGPAADPDAALRFVRETRLAARLNHPNIVAVYDAFEQDGAPYMAMEYLRQGSLKPRIGHLSPAQIIGVLEGLLAALDHAEQHAIVHRDIKPANLLVADSGAVKVADFGIAKTGALDAFGTITVTGTTLGTPQYMAPEQALGRRLTPAADRYSAGVLAYELLAGFTPFFDIEEPMAVMQSHINQPPASVIEVDEGVDPALSRWVDALLAKDPAARPRSAAAAWESLERVAIDRLGPAWRDAASLVEGAGPLAPAPFTRSDDARTVSLDTAGDTPRAATAVRGIKGPGPLIPLGGLLRPPVLLALVLVLAFVAIELRNKLDKSDGTTVG